MAADKKTSSSSVQQAKTKSTKKSKNDKKSSVVIPVVPSPIIITPFRQKILWGMGFVLLGVLLWFYMGRPGEVVGKIQPTNSQEILRNAKVSLDQAKEIPVSDSTGTFMFSNVKSGKHKLRFSAPGHQDKILDVDLTAGESKRLTVLLKPLEQEALLKGNILVIGTREPNQLIFKNLELKTVKTIALEGRPSSIVIQDKLVYIAETDKDRVSLLNLDDGKISQSIELSPHAEPSKIIALPDGKLMVLNRIGKSLTLIDPDKLETVSQNAFQMPIFDMAMPESSSSIWVTGNGSISTMSYPANEISSPVQAPVSMSADVQFDFDNNRILIPQNKNLNIFDLAQNSIETFSFPDKLEQIMPIASRDFIVAGEGNISRVLLDQQVTIDKTFKYESAAAESILKLSDEQAVLLTSKPNMIYLLDLNTMNTSVKELFNGRFEFALLHDFE